MNETTTIIDGITVTVHVGTMPHSEIEQYVKIFSGKCKDKRLERLEITVDGDYADVDVYFKPVPFERIRRITGYLYFLFQWRASTIKNVADDVSTTFFSGAEGGI